MPDASLLIKQNNRPDMSMEFQAGGIVCGIDEAGRGPIAGPVVASAIILDCQKKTQDLLKAINDSKKLSPAKRVILAEQLTATMSYGIGIADVTEIDEINIHHATLLAMQRAFDNLIRNFYTIPSVALIDGKFAPDLSCRTKTVVGGDAKSLSIAAASIIAKVHRDNIMHNLAKEYPGYGWEKNAGYPTQEHKTALLKLGITPHHRKSYAPVKNTIKRNNSK